MPQRLWDRIKSDKLALLTVSGSIASLIALSIVLLDKVSIGSNIPPQTNSWRILFIVMALLAAGANVLYTYHWVRDAVSKQISTHHKIRTAAIRILIGCLILGVCLDGLFAALYWEPWLIDILRLFSMFRHYIIQALH